MNTTDFQRGAIALINAAKMVPQIVACDSEQTTPEYFSKQDAAISALVSAAGPMPPKAAGAMAALASLLVYVEQDGGLPYLDKEWRPPAAMSSADLEEYRDRFAAEVGC